ncbi:hypothetical protein PN462_12740 [Spirulina sp. CS-785/01]|uniref:hypothetical protein n=1 Tax=Spirulina sp. CS-785/01 TaxID=3021716 RepID=UPI00232DD57A|nr:hypothetical protein [Spirulina sp. CS-785/01]MDB9313972.1 hypothetical protein [Spirulina sp. CS-785/01]
MTRLYQYARIGDIDGVEREAQRLEQQDSRYAEFSQQILDWASEFNDRAILELITPVITRTQGR